MKNQVYWNWMDGDYTKSPTISTLSSSVLHGYGVFETLYYNNYIRLFEAHLKRLKNGIFSYEMEVPNAFREIPYIINDLIERNNLKEARVRISVIARESALCTGKIPSSLIISAFPYHRESLSRSLKTTLSKETSPTLSLNKSTSYAGYILAKRKAFSSGYDDALFLDQEGRIIECSSANIFLFKDNKWYTPDLSNKGLSGIQRRIVLDAMNNLNIPIYVTSCAFNEDAYSFAFITNSLIGLQEIKSINGVQMSATPSSFAKIKREWSKLEI